MGERFRSIREEEEISLFDQQTFRTERKSDQAEERKEDVAYGGIVT